MITICGVAGNEGASQMTAALIKWPLMNKEMKEVGMWCVGMSVELYV